MSDPTRPGDTSVQRGMPRAGCALGGLGCAALPVFVGAVNTLGFFHSLGRDDVGPFALNLGFLLFGLALLGGSAWLLVVAFRRRAFARCPTCDAQLELPAGFDTRPYPVPCAGCERFCHVEDGRLVPTPPTFVAPRPVLRAELLHDPALPRTCCACGAPATRILRVERHEARVLRNLVYTLATGGGLIFFGGGATYTAMLPFCDEHDRGAALGRDEAHMTISVPSLLFFTAYCEMNGLDPLPPDQATLVDVVERRIS